jgi:hypothetical protein
MAQPEESRAESALRENLAAQTAQRQPDVRSLADIVTVAPWVEIEVHLDHLRERVDSAVIAVRIHAAV